MKFSISFKYSNVTFKNKETKETISFETKAQDGNSFTFDNVDEDVVIGVLKGIKDRKSAQLFANTEFRNEFINAMAKNKSKELYDRLESGEWKIEDVVVSGMTIKDLEFTKPTMNARETMTVESKTRKINEAKAHQDSHSREYNFNEIIYDFKDFRKGMRVHHRFHPERHGTVEFVTKVGRHAEVRWDDKDHTTYQVEFYYLIPDKPRKWRHGFKLGDVVDVYRNENYFYPNCTIVELTTSWGEPVIGVIREDGKDYDDNMHVMRTLMPEWVFRPGESPMGDGRGKPS